MKKVTEWCPFCDNEVKINAIPCVAQKCPKCGSTIRACCLCDHDNCDCVKCEEENQ